MADFTSSIIVQIATRHLRTILNGAISPFSPGDISRAIREDQSLWGVGESEIRKYGQKIPGIETMGKSFVANIERDYGSITSLVIMWLREDQAMKYGMIVNTPGGIEWLDKQVNEILSGIGLRGEE